MRALLAAILAAAALLATSASASSPQATSPVYLPLIVQTGDSSSPRNEVYVSDFRSFTSLYDSRLVVGEVTNGTSQTVYNVRVEVRLYDAVGAVLLRDTRFTQILQIAPGGRAGFSWLDISPPDGVARVEASVVEQYKRPFTGYSLATVVSASAGTFSGGARAFGVVRNDGPGVLSNIQVVATYYDADGHVLDVNFSYIGSALQPGATASYAIDTYNIPSCDHVAVAAEGYRLTTP